MDISDPLGKLDAVEPVDFFRRHEDQQVHVMLRLAAAAGSALVVTGHARDGVVHRSQAVAGHFVGGIFGPISQE